VSALGYDIFYEDDLTTADESPINDAVQDFTMISRCIS